MLYEVITGDEKGETGANRDVLEKIDVKIFKKKMEHRRGTLGLSDFVYSYKSDILI